ncbi:LuxR family transcriptional regulator [Actinomycetospora sp. TBRC 11914]|uniref:LuxR family transcriptional regulator n=1 Tax=Actinomycetospora sp. TBRC 11914 TaxID=2729387 RepID=UPI00145E2AE1|nr:LuxR family transcriptional regulator [Actinomycetospora sp. TBRC 11914]NMO89851.1 LuxR family transcriptional regulator [Actinomycetospora sp. TBRC 11914]
MRKLSLDALARQQLERAADSSSGRAADTVYGGHEHVLRQTMITLMAGSSLSEHDGPAEATLEVRRGRVRLVAGADTWDGRTGDLLIVPTARHTLQALETSVVLLTVVRSP